MPSLVEEHHEPQPPDRRVQRRGHEPISVGVKGVLIGGAVIVLVVAVALAISYAMFVSYSVPADSDRPRLEVRDALRVPIVPLDADQPSRRRALQAEESRLLGRDPSESGYVWIDEREGIARIPIDAAIDLIAERGLGSAQASQSPPAPEESPAPSESPSAEPPQTPSESQTPSEPPASEPASEEQP